MEPKCPRCGQEMVKVDAIVLDSDKVEPAVSINDTVVGYVCKNQACQKPKVADSE